MPLGEQFRNTYWFNEHGRMISALDTGEGKPAYTMGEEVPEGFDKPIQGMLFSPHTGTGRRDDPLVPHSDRIQAINAALGTDYRNVGSSRDPETLYREALTSEWKATGQLKRDPNFKTFPSKEDTSKDRQALVNAMDNSGMTIDEIRGVETEAVLDSTMRYNGLAYHRSDHTTGRGGGRIVIHPTTNADSLSESLMHEVGHARDTAISDKRNNLVSHTKRVKGADPVQEGLADAHMDRHHTYKDVYPEHMERQLVERLAQGKDGGYGLSHWTSQHDKALYAATRIAAARNPDAFRNIPTRSELALARTGSVYTDRDVQKLMLGHLVEQNPGIHEALSAMDEHHNKKISDLESSFKERYGDNTKLVSALPKPRKLAQTAKSSKKYYENTKMPANPISRTRVDTDNVRQNSAIARFREHEVEPHPELDLQWGSAKKRSSKKTKDVQGEK